MRLATPVTVRKVVVLVHTDQGLFRYDKAPPDTFTLADDNDVLHTVLDLRFTDSARREPSVGGKAH